MRINVDAEKLHINDIIEGLNNYRHLLCDQDDSFNVEVVSMLAAVKAYASIQRGILPIFFGSETLKECCHYVASAMDLVRYINKITDKKKLKKIKAHLKLVGTGGFGIYATYQKLQFNSAFAYEQLTKEKNDTKINKEVERDAARKSIELMLALAALNKFDDVILEDPLHSSDTNPNPDLIVVEGENRYGIACKSISSTNKSNFIQHVEYAIKQLRKALGKKSIGSGLGIVFIDVSALLNHDKLFMPNENFYWDSHAAPAVILNEVSQVLSNVLGSGDVHSILGPLFKKADVAPCVVIYAHGLMIAGDGQGEAPRYYKPMRVLTCGDHSKVAKFLTKLNEANHCQ
ncbi:hypothetical protein DES53_102246 [Roseimicrobium gellanilyticum]|uniref:Uncharacterized protein n=1 Tax=Roseimicrobium gellanilyticum TaxID=748857 RepID=A0A366HQD7_9BACT|nr:hypothetical protein [Roseimicrobium gellanilyticum]RBP45862.1 hypothetical protein DES53_102246 [Roseimicrobium gellanilyticum]